MDVDSKEHGNEEEIMKVSQLIEQLQQAKRQLGDFDAEVELQVPGTMRVFEKVKIMPIANGQDSYIIISNG